MRYEGGGSLDKLLHPAKGGKLPLSTDEKLRILDLIACGLAELHRADIIHGDLKPANILLSHHQPPEIRLADFGLANMRENENKLNINMSTLMKTGATKGTKLYCAPEMLVNPFNTNFDERVAKSSRKTDMYAFGLMCWEVLSREKPFSDVRTDAALCAKVHQGHRPSIGLLPIEVQATSIGDMIECCWSVKRSDRLSAEECYSILNHYYTTFSHKQYDIFFSHAWKNKPFLTHVHNYLVRMGYIVWYDQSEMRYNMIDSMKSGITNSTVVLACLSSVFQTRENCMFEIREAMSLSPPKPIVPIIIEENVNIWMSQELASLFNVAKDDFSTKSFVDISMASKLQWEDSEGIVTKEMSHVLESSLSQLIPILNNLGCKPTLKIQVSR
jgi:serine/threonine protein kinase